MMSSAYVFSMGLTALSNVAYHLSQRAISSGINPLASLLVSYATALLVTLVALVVFPPAGGGLWSASTWGHLNWASFGVGVAAVGLELGFLWAYRAGWKLSTAALYSNVLVTIALIPLGMLLFNEAFTLRRGVGILLALSGLWALAT